jgi:hypothetical protein
MDDFGSVSSLIESVGTAENLVQLNSIIKKFAPHVGIQNLGLLYRKITSGTPWQIPPQIRHYVEDPTRISKIWVD